MSSSRIESKLPLEVLEELGTDHKPVIVMSEGNDPRVINGALAAYNKGVCQIVLLGSELIINAEFTKLDVDLPSGVKIIDPEKSELLIEFEKEYFNLRKKKGISIEEARSKV